MPSENIKIDRSFLFEKKLVQLATKMLDDRPIESAANSSSISSDCSHPGQQRGSHDDDDNEDDTSRVVARRLELAATAAEAASSVEAFECQTDTTKTARDLHCQRDDIAGNAGYEKQEEEEAERDHEEEEVSLGERQAAEEPLPSPPQACRVERSNSCSQAEIGAHSSAISGFAAAGGASSACSSSLAIDTGGCNVLRIEDNLLNNTNNQQQQQQTTSASQENITLSLAQSKSINQSLPTIASSASASNLIDVRVQDEDEYSYNNSGLGFSKTKNNNDIVETNLKRQHQQSSSLQQQQQSSHQQQSSSSRFFSSKLNTGSLWSLLSVGSNSSYSDQQTATNDNNSMQDNQAEQLNAQQNQQDQSRASTTVGGFFSRVQFKRNTQTSSQQQDNSVSSSSSKQHDPNYKQTPNSTVGQESSNSSQISNSKRFRFNIKYIGSTILHKNFTMPMLEWIARDIKRQTIKGAQCISQRQFNIPSREIVFEIQANSLTAISCKDKQPIFIHPMHCISKYAQLQHDQTCFSYFIRDTKESPYYCHIFQAKSASKVHDIFQAIREATTTTASLQLMSHNSLSTSSSSTPFSLQKSQSTDGGVSFLSINQKAEVANSANKQTTQILAANSQQQQQQQQQIVSPLLLNKQQLAAGPQFEDSYQFEVMFVKKVKLQCRRVPASFVDDALETLKSFEVLKGGVESKANQIKGSVGKRPIINASVDERQEYDEVAQSPPPQTGSKYCVQTQSSSSTDTSSDTASEQRRGSSVSLHKLQVCSGKNNDNDSSNFEKGESRSCQQSPTKLIADNEESPMMRTGDEKNEQHEAGSSIREQMLNMKKHQSMDCLKSIADYSIKTAKAGNAPNYANDFSPYSTITSNDLNERIAAIPVVSTSSVSLDHETRQKLARQVRETIMATAASIKKDVYASGDKLDSSSSSKALDSLSCTVISSVPPVFNTDEDIDSTGLMLDQQHDNNKKVLAGDNNYWLVSDSTLR